MRFNKIDSIPPKSTISERVAKKQEEENPLRSHTSLSGLKDREERQQPVDIVPKESKYNYPEAEELVGGQEYPKELENRQKFGGAFVDVEDLSNSPLEIEAQTEETLKEKIASLNTDEDVYDFAPIIVKLYESFKEKNQKNKEWKKEREFNKFFKQVNDFLKQYRDILAKKMTEKKEYPAIKQAFKKTIGDLVYSGYKIDVLDNFAKIKNGRAPRTAEKILNSSLGRRGSSKVKKSIRPYAKTSRNNNNYRKGRVIKATNLQAYNPRTGQKEAV